MVSCTLKPEGLMFGESLTKGVYLATDSPYLMIVSNGKLHTKKRREHGDGDTISALGESLTKGLFQ